VQAEVVIADLTGRSPNVMYELGLAHVIGKKVIITTQDMDDLPVDLRGLPVLEYSYNGTGAIQYLDDLTRSLVAARAQPSQESLLLPMGGGGIERIRAEILSISPQHAIVRLPGDRIGVLKAEDWDWTRKRNDLTLVNALSVGANIDGYYFLYERENRFSPKDPRENPWPRAEKELQIGTEVQGKITNVRPFGAFVDLRYGIAGLVHETHFPAGFAPVVGNRVTVRVDRFDSATREIQLSLVRDSSKVAPPDPIFKRGMKFTGVIHRVLPDRGYVLVKVESRLRPVLLHRADMSSKLGQMFDSSCLEFGQEIVVEVETYDQARDSVTVRDVG